jgi:hypothetical protein
MTRVINISFIIYLLILGACSTRKNKPDHSNIIPEKELVSILTDIYITDGILSIPKIRGSYPALDSTSTYIKIIEKKGYTKETMDKTMKYYFIKNPKKLIRIYDLVLGNLSERESLVQKEVALAEEVRQNLWTGKNFYCLPDPSGKDSSGFNITINKNGIYELIFSATLFPDDQSVNPRITVFSCNPDSIETGKRNYIKSYKYIKDGQPHTYILKLIVPGNKTLNFKGWIFDSDNNHDMWEKHVIINNISLVYSSVAPV